MHRISSDIMQQPAAPASMQALSLSLPMPPSANIGIGDFWQAAARAAVPRGAAPGLHAVAKMGLSVA